MSEAKLATGVVDDVSVEKLRIDFAGNVLKLGDPGFDEARLVFNGMFADRKPAVILQCTSTEDVVSAVRFARESGLIVAVKGGGHSIAGFSAVEGGVLIDLSLMKRIDVDAEGRTAKAQPGVKWAELDTATQAHGLATPGGFISSTGIAGLTLNGGLVGYLTRKFGMACDNLVEAEVVTAEGEVVRTSESENPDLLWGLRGGGGNFGIVTQFTFKLHPVTDIFLSISMYPVAKGDEVFRAYREHAPKQPDELFSGILYFTVPVDPMMPEELHGQKVFAAMGAYVGPEADGQTHTAFLNQVPGSLASFSMTIPYLMAQQMQDSSSLWGEQNYWKSGLLNDLTDEAIEAIVSLAPTATSPKCALNLLYLRGAISRVGEGDTAYSNRDVAYNFSIDNVWEDPSENDQQIEWARAFFAQMEPYLTGVYLNFIGDEGQDRVKDAYGAKYERLVALKRKYDPTNLFRLNQNIKPD